MGCGNSKSTNVKSQGGPTLYIYSASAPCRSVMMVAQHAGVPLKLENLDLLQGEHKSPKFLKINPEHTVPTLKDGKFSLWESRPIMQYLVDMFAPGHDIYPKDAQKRALVDRALYKEFDLSKAVSLFVYPQVFQQAEPDKEKEEAMTKQLESFKISGDYILGEQPTLADFSAAAHISLLELVEYDLGKWKKLAAWYKRMKSLPVWEKCNEGLEHWKKALKAAKEAPPKEK